MIVTVMALNCLPGEGPGEVFPEKKKCSKRQKKEERKW
jgi:hypothetical protein